MSEYLKIHPNDNVAVALTALPKGRAVEMDGVVVQLREEVPAGHKWALQAISRGEPVIKYGMPIGEALVDIPTGTHVHTAVMKTRLKGLKDYVYTPVKTPLPIRSLFPDTFRGFRRKDGRVGIRNEIWIINTVGCVNKTADRLCSLAELDRRDRYEGIYTFNHPYGCSQLGEDQETTRKILAGLVRHPNAGGVLVLGLGCENNHIEGFKEVLGDFDPDRVRFLVCQEVEDEIDAGLEIIEELAEILRGDQRVSCSIDCLTLGLKCGGSDGLSGITANPLIGQVSDQLTAAGGTAFLTEVPEMFGAEQILMNRARNVEVFNKIVRLINGFKEYYLRYNQAVYENPSPGNKAGGITTLEDKSLGCIQKGGSGPVEDVLNYGEIPRKQGLLLLNGPGNDAVAVTNLIAAGAQIVLFSTGRGTPLGGPVPTLKIATNTVLWKKKSHWIDFNAGELVEGGDADEILSRLISLIMETAEGRPACNEKNGYREIALFKDGVTL